MDLAHPYSIVSNRLDGAALIVLAGTTQPLTGHQIARQASEGTQQGIGKALQRLLDHGLVIRTDAGSAHLYVLNREHVGAPVAELLAGLRPALFSRLKQRIADWDEQAVQASLFGSASRGEGSIDSDIDIVVVRPGALAEDDETWRSQIDELARAVFRWTGNRAAISELAEADLDRLAQERPPIVDELRADAMTLVGPDFRALLERHL